MSHDHCAGIDAQNDFCGSLRWSHYFYELIVLNKSTKIKIKYLLGAAFFVLLSYSLYHQISSQKNLQERWMEITEVWKSPGIYLVILLMFFNWGIEAAKWRYMLKPIQKLDFLTALKSIFAGCAVTMITPNRMGEFGGRILFVLPEHRLRAVSISIIGSISQTLTTFIAGSAALIFFINSHFVGEGQVVADFLHQKTIWLVSIGITVLLALLFFYENAVWRILQRIPLVNKYLNYLSIRDLYPHKTLLRILGFSFLRYLVFILQYIMILKTLQIEIQPLSAIAMSAVFFLSMALAPTLGFLELPVRSQLGLALFGLLTNDLLGLQTATAAIWLINIIAPAVIGLFIILFTKYKNP